MLAVNKYLWWSLLALLNVMDAHTTQILLTSNPDKYYEWNPLMNSILQGYGWSGLIGVKIFMLLLFFITLLHMDRNYTRAMVAVTLLYFTIVLRTLIHIYLNF